MPPVPEWLADILRQFPVVALAGLAGWLGHRTGRSGLREELVRADRERQDVWQRADGEIARARGDRDRAEQMLEAERAKLDRLNAEHNRYVRGQQRAAEKRAEREGR